MSEECLDQLQKRIDQLEAVMADCMSEACTTPEQITQSAVPKIHWGAGRSAGVSDRKNYERYDWMNRDSNL